MTVTLQTRNLHKTYDKEVKAVQGIDLEIKKGEVFGLLGPNGAGKTTLIKMLVGILKPDKGEILFNGIKLNGTTELKGMIGYAPQELVFYPFLTVLENMQLYASLYSIKNTRKRIDEILELFQLTELSKRQAEKMSGGQKRRLNIALSLLHSPQILFLDEPSSSMDPQSRNVLWESVEQLKEKEGVTILLSTHLMEVADKLSDRVAIIDHGKVLTVGTPDELKSKYAAIETVEIQFTKNISPSIHKKITLQLKDKYKQFSTANDRFFIKTKNGLKAISDIMKTIESLAVLSYLQDIQLRLGTLEDVFLNLTGKELRENNFSFGGDRR